MTKRPLILDILNRPWALTEGKLTELVAIYERHENGAKFDVEGLRAAAGDRFGSNTEDTNYEIQNGVAIIPIEGVLSKRMNLFSYFSGGTSTQILTDMIERAAADPAVHSLLLSVDSPGGEVDGTQICADAVAAANKSKTVLAWLDGCCCSAAYWIASQTTAVYLADSTTQVGSIGVVATHVDRSEANKQSGRTVTEITAGKYKRIASSNAPLSPEGRQSIQDDLDYLYGLFLGAVGDGRGVETDTVHADMGDGRVFIGQQAIDAGLADGVASRDELISRLASDYYNRLSNPGAAAAAYRTPPAKETIMAFKTFATEAEYNAEINAAVERGKASATVTSAAVDAARVEGATAERERIIGIEAVPLAAHHSEVVAKLKADGKSTAADAAVEILKAEGALQAQHGRDRREELPNPAPASRVDTVSPAPEAGKDENTITPAGITAHMAKAKSEGRDLSPADAAIEMERAQSAK